MMPIDTRSGGCTVAGCIIPHRFWLSRGVGGLLRPLSCLFRAISDETISLLFASFPPCVERGAVVLA